MNNRDAQVMAVFSKSDRAYSAQDVAQWMGCGDFIGICGVSRHLENMVERGLMTRSGSPGKTTYKPTP